MHHSGGTGGFIRTQTTDTSRLTQYMEERQKMRHAFPCTSETAITVHMLYQMPLSSFFCNFYAFLDSGAEDGMLTPKHSPCCVEPEKPN
mmetsp:Transcript_8799/g.22161  ORF Transcript_8799/g.22161 Transcript_8799/m.22161 type:complete len:89 (-) Transcript_8799:231-497(-)